MEKSEISSNSVSKWISRGKQRNRTYKEIHQEELAQRILKGEKSHDVESVDWRPGKAALMWVQKPEKQDHWWCKSTREECVSARGREQILPSSVFYSGPPAQAGRCPRALGGQSAFLILPTQTLISSRYTLKGTPRKTFNGISGHSVAKLVWHVKIAITLGYIVLLIHTWSTFVSAPAPPISSHCVPSALGSHLPSPCFRACALPILPSGPPGLLPHLLRALTEVSHPRWGFRQPSVLKSLPPSLLPLPFPTLFSP